MAVLAALQSAALRLVGQRPPVFFGSSGQIEIELCDLVNEVAQEIVDYADWQGLTRLHTISGNGVTTDFNLPDDYGRQLIRSDVQDLDSWAWGYQRCTDINDFLCQQARGLIPIPGIWIINDNLMQFAPAPSSGNPATFPYLTKNYATSSDTLEGKDAFTADTDTFGLAERLLTLGLVWKWREQKKLDFTGDQENFQNELNKAAAKDKGSRIYRSGRRGFFRGTYPAWPWTLGPA